MFVEFVKCFSCDNLTDLLCIVCQKWYCELHVRHCVQCEGASCIECFKEDKCCLVRPYGKTQQHLEEFYKDKFVDGGHSLFVLDEIDMWCEILDFPRHEARDLAAKRSVERFVDNFDADVFFREDRTLLIPKHFPPIERYKNQKEQLVEFLRNILMSDIFPSILMLSEDRSELLALVFDEISQSQEIKKYLSIQSATNEEGKFSSLSLLSMTSSIEGAKLFSCLKEKNLLDISYFEESCLVYHLEAYQWLESKSNEKLDFSGYVNPRADKVIAYLFSERGMTMDCFLNHRRSKIIAPKVVEMLLRIKGVEQVKQIEKRMILNAKVAKKLKKAAFTFDEQKAVSPPFSPKELYFMACFKLMKLDPLKREKVVSYALKENIKACKEMLPFMAIVRREKILTFLICCKTLYGNLIPNQILWTILDYTYSTINQRG